jgi:hypothetical protein
MIRKAEAEKAIRSLATKWFRRTHPAVADPSMVMPSFEDFIFWVRSQGYGHYLEFRSTLGPREDAELWFDQELKQTWRN